MAEHGHGFDDGRRSIKFQKIAAKRRESQGAMLQRQVEYCLGPKDCLHVQPLDSAVRNAAEQALENSQETSTTIIKKTVEKSVVLAFDVGSEKQATLPTLEGENGAKQAIDALAEAMDIAGIKLP